MNYFKYCAPLVFIMACSSQPLDQFEDYKLHNIKKLGFSFRLPPKHSISFHEGGNHVFLLKDSITIGGITRKPNTFSKVEFLEAASRFGNEKKRTEYILTADSTSIICKYGKDLYFFNLGVTNYYSFFLWTKDGPTKNDIINTFNFEYLKLSTDYINRIDYEIAGDKKINFLNNRNFISKNGDNFFSINTEKHKDFVRYIVTASGNGATLYNRSENFFNVTFSEKEKDSISINVASKLNDGTIKHSFRKKFQVR